MPLLSQELVNVLDRVTSRNHDSTPDYKRRIAQNVRSLDEITAPSTNLSSLNSLQSFLQASDIIFPGRALIPGHKDYKAAQQQNWASACWLSAGCILKLHNAVEVALSLKLATFFRATFAVRSGGHMASPGYGSIESSGVLFDLGGMNEISVSTDLCSVAVGPAATWDAIYEELEKQERTVVGGRAAGVAVGGFILGGGMSHFSNHWALGCDNVKSFEVVLADSSIVQASATNNQDLFAVLKGGGPNFGIVTRFDLITYTDFSIWYNMKAYAPTDADNVMRAVVEVQNRMEADDRIGFLATVYPDSFVMVFLYRGGPPKPEVFNAFESITPASELMPAAMGTQCSLARMLAIPKPFKGNIGNLSIRPKAELYIQLHQTLRECLKTSPPSVSACFTIQPFGKRAVQKSLELGENCMNIANEPQGWLAIVAKSPEDDDFEVTKSIAQQLVQSLGSVAAQSDALLDFRFMNDSSALQSPLQGYGAKGMAQIAAASQKWDPNGVFQTLQNSGFLISKAVAN